MTWGAIGGAAIGVVGGALAGKSQNKANQKAAEEANYMNRLKAPYLEGAWQKGEKTLNSALDLGSHFSGQRVADLNGWQTAGTNQAYNYATGRGQADANTLSTTGNSMLTAGNRYIGNAATMYGQAQIDPTQRIINNASQYANNPHVDGLIDSASRDVTRNLYEQQMPTLAKSATGTGNINSTKHGVESAILQRGAADRLADVSSSIRGKFFDQGLQMSQNQYNQSFNNQLNANGQMSNATTQGVDMMYRGQNMSANNVDMLTGAGGLLQNHSQNVLNGNKDAWNEARTGNMNLLTQYTNMLGDAGQWQAAQPVSTVSNAIGMGMMGSQIGTKIGNYLNSPPAQTQGQPVYTGQSGWAGNGGWGDSVGGEGE